MVEGEFNFWVPGSMLYRHEIRSEDTRLDDTFPLLSSDRGYSSLSPMSRLRKIEEGRKELMEMIRDMPESCYELSLKDIVVNQHPEAGLESCPARTEAEVDDKQRKNKKKRTMKDASTRPSQVTRTSSMEAGSFLIRMFLPAFLTSSKKPASGHRSKSSQPLFSPRVSLDWSDRREISKDLKVGRRPFPGEDWSPEGTSRSKSCTSRIERGGGGFLSRCWPFGGTNNSKAKVIKGKMIRQKTCVF
ncbi:hypothetical protein MLD38_031485 [Melastoma candidum]|uniref:Uncharacterized protein n=1 Tax=Melastoma candidum TaxID=119954 RepID=A0ACB9MQD2_9MYRT|nr:hypothetical protein MLD38_031485 [Melastoma candidum]